MMKFSFLLTLFLAVSFSYSQTTNSNILLERYSESELNELKEHQPEEYQILLNALERGVFIGDIPTQKGKEIEFDGTLEVDLTEDHTFISLGLQLKENNYQYYKIKGTNKLVGVLPKSLLE